MEYDPLKQLTDFFKSEGYVGKEAVEEAKAELERRHQRQLDLNQSAGKFHRLLFFVPPSVSAYCSFKSHSFNIYDSYDDWTCLISFPKSYSLYADIDNTPGGKNFKLENMFSFSKSAFGSGMRMVQSENHQQRLFNKSMRF